MRRRFLPILIAVVLVFSIFAMFPLCQSELPLEPIKLYPTDDSFVGKQEMVDGVLVNTTDKNYGDRQFLLVTTTTVDDRDRRAFLKFSLSSIPSPENITFVRLFLFTYDWVHPALGFK